MADLEKALKNLTPEQRKKLKNYEDNDEANLNSLADSTPPEPKKNTKKGKSNLNSAVPEGTSRNPVITCMQSIESEEVHWLWRGYIAMCKICIIEGDPSHGKTWTTLAIAAAVSNGWPLPDALTGIMEGAYTEPHNIFYLTAEDGLADTIKPRLEMLGADCNRIFVIEGQRKQNGTDIEPVTMQDLDIMRKAMQEIKPALLIIDPLQGFLGAGVDMHRANETRPVLTGIMRLAEEYNCAVLIVRHLNKSTGGKAAYRGMGSIDFTATARTVLLVGKDPDDPHKRIIVPTKCNLGAEGVPIAFTLTPEYGFQWAGKADRTADDVLYADAQNNHNQNANNYRVDEAVEFLRDLLSTGPKESKHVMEEAKHENISSRTLQRAKEKLDVKSFRDKPGIGPWIWRLPSAQRHNGNVAISFKDACEKEENIGTKADCQPDCQVVSNGNVLPETTLPDCQPWQSDKTPKKSNKKSRLPDCHSECDEELWADIGHVVADHEGGHN